jgi:hypothetical protein
MARALTFAAALAVGLTMAHAAVTTWNNAAHMVAPY